MHARTCIMITPTPFARGVSHGRRPLRAAGLSAAHGAGCGTHAGFAPHTIFHDQGSRSDAPSASGMFRWP